MQMQLTIDDTLYNWINQPESVPFWDNTLARDAEALEYLDVTKFY